MTLLFGLLVLAIVAAVAYGWGGKAGIIALVVAVLAAAVMIGMRSSEGAMAVGYSLAFGWPALVAAIALGAFAGSLFRQGRYAIALLPFLPILLFMWHHHGERSDEVSEQGQVFDFVFSHKELGPLAGENLRARLMTRTTYSDRRPGRYEFSLNTKEPLYAIVLVDRSSGRPNIRLACVTRLHTGQRDTRRDPCADHVVSLDALRSMAVPARTARKMESAGEAIPQFPPIPGDAQVSMVGVYQAKSAKPRQQGVHEPADIVVTIAASKVPLVLVLSSYEPVRWLIANQGRPLPAILLSGYHPSTVVGTQATSLVIGRKWFYQEGGQEYREFEKKITAYVPGRRIGQFQGAYQGAEFLVPAPAGDR